MIVKIAKSSQNKKVLPQEPCFVVFSCNKIFYSTFSKRTSNTCININDFHK